jgi:hypothetical protein
MATTAAAADGGASPPLPGGGEAALTAAAAAAAAAAPSSCAAAALAANDGNPGASAVDPGTRAAADDANDPDAAAVKAAWLAVRAAPEDYRAWVTLVAAAERLVRARRIWLFDFVKEGCCCAHVFGRRPWQVVGVVF